MPRERWAKQALLEILGGKYDSSWYKGITKARLAVGQGTTGDSSHTTGRGWKNILKVAWANKQQKDWTEAKANMRSLHAHPKEFAKGVEDIVWEDSKRSSTFIKLRLGDVIKPQGPRKNYCEACQEKDIRDLREHLILDCVGNEEKRRKTQINKVKARGRRLGRNSQQITQEILGNTTR